jgi:hypothetical protein
MSIRLIEQAQNILNTNFQSGGYTIPCKGLYPFQWKWDAGFIAIGYAHYDIEKAKTEINSLLSSQWLNGFIPHIVFHQESDTYFPGPDFHQSELNPLSNKNYPSTGMTQPPVVGFTLEKMYHIAKDKKDILQFIKQNIDKVYTNHNYFYTNRDPKNEGLVYIYHNWESGTDNSPVWDDIWATMNPPEYKVERKDIKIIDPSERPTNREYDHYLYIIDIAKEHKYDDKKIAEYSPFLVQDPLFNTLLIKSNQSLINLYRVIGGNEDKIKQLEEWQSKSVNSFNNKLYNADLGAYVYYDLRNEKYINQISSSSFAPLYAGIPTKDQASKIVKTMLDKFGGENRYLCASFDPDSSRFNPKKYWRGPVWINMNWFLYYGLLDYGYVDLANKIKSDSIELITKAGFYEYFNPNKEVYKYENGGYGGSDFSWTAALYIDLINN